MPEPRGRSPWIYVGIGCVVALGLLLSGAVTLGLLGYRWVKQVETENKDPDVRAARVKEVLGCEELPEGYHPVVGFSLPFVTDIAVLSDRPRAVEDSRGDPFGERGFIYVKLLTPAGQDEQEVRDYFEGRTDDSRILRRNRIRLRTRNSLGRGVIGAQGQTLLYLAQRGELELSEHRGRGLNAMILVDCPQDRKLRLGIWFAPDPAPEAEAGSAQLAGTPADPEAIRAFMARFRLCR